MGDPTKHVHARYLHQTEIVMPHLDAGRCCAEDHDLEAEYEAWAAGDPENGVAAQQGLNPRAVVHEGDVVLMDQASAEGREDFEVVEDHLYTPPEASDADPPEASDADPPSAGSTEAIEVATDAKADGQARKSKGKATDGRAGASSAKKEV